MDSIYFKTVSFSELLKLYKHHVSLLKRDSLLRVLNSSELDFLSLFTLYNSHLITQKDFRLGCYKYFYC